MKLGLVAVLVVGGLVAWMMIRSTRASSRPIDVSVVQFALTDELQNGPGSAVAVSPDRRYLVYVGWRDGVDRLFRRSFDELDSVPLPHTERARSPFVSPDGQWVGFFADGKLKKVRIEGSRAVTICEAPGNPGGADWGTDGTIVFALLGSGLLRTQAAGGTPAPLSEPVDRAADVDYRWPALLPGGRVVIFTVWSGSAEKARLAVESLETGEQRMLGPGSQPRVAGTDHLVFAQADGLWAAPFDPASLSLTGSPVRVVDSVQLRHGGAADYDVAQDGSLVYAPSGPEPTNELAWVDLEGRVTPIAPDRRLYSTPRVSPEGGRVAVGVRSPGGTFGIWVYDIALGTATHLPTEAASFDPVWTPDGKRITFASTMPGPSHLYWIDAEGSAPPEVLLKNQFGTFPSSWSSNGSLLAFQEMNPSSGVDIWVLSRSRERSRVLATPFDETQPRFSHDGRWLAYTSNAGGRDQVYVEPYPRTGARWLVSARAGREPIWSRDGSAIYYRSLAGNQVFRVAVTFVPSFVAGRPFLLLEGPYERHPTAGYAANYDVASDGQGFVMITREEDPAPQQILLVANWLEALRRSAPHAKSGSR